MKLDNFVVIAAVCAVLIVAPASPASAQQVFAYPKAGQTQQQQMQDRGECHQWAVGQTGYNPSAPQPPAGGYAPPPPPPAPAAWHMAENGQAMGPFAANQMAEAARNGRLRPDTLVWTQGMTGWVAASQVPQLAGLFMPQPPPSPA